jgi:vacuolar protein sorting-associated protein 26
VTITFNEHTKRHRHKLTDRKDRSERYPTFYDKEDISGTIKIKLTSKTFEHKGIKIELKGTIERISKLKSKNDFISLTQDLCQGGILTENITEYPFCFKQVQKKYESYKGDYAVVSYYIKVTIETKVRNISYEKEFAVVNPNEESILKENDEPIKLGVGIKDLLKLSIDFKSRNCDCKGTLKGVITFNNVNLGLKYMEIQIMRREILIGAENDCEPAFLAKFEIMDGGPIKNEKIPIRLFLKPYDLTPTYGNVDNKFFVKYFLNMVIVDSEEQRYFKQKEIVLFRVRKKKESAIKEKEGWITANLRDILNEESDSESENENKELNMNEVIDDENENTINAS